MIMPRWHFASLLVWVTLLAAAVVSAQNSPRRFANPLSKPTPAKTVTPPKKTKKNIKSTAPKVGGAGQAKQKKQWGDPKKWGNPKKWSKPKPAAQEAPAPKAVLPSEIERLEKEIEDLRAELRAARVVRRDVKTRGLTETEKQEKASLQDKRVALQRQRDSIIKAIEGGLDPALVKQNLDEIDAEIAAVNRKLEALEEAAHTPVEPPPTISQQAEAMQSEIAALKAELERMKAAQEREMKRVQEEVKVEAEKQEEADKSLREQIGEVLPIELFAFGDFFFAYRESGDDGFEIGQLEMDLNQELGKYVTVSVAVAYDSDAENFGVGAYTIDGHLAGKGEGHLFSTDALETSGIVFGRFDVPFGIDYLEYPSIARRLVTGPIAVDMTHDAWNDLGGQLYLDAKVFNMMFYVVNGFGYGIEEPVGEGETEETSVNDREVDVALGSRLGAKPADVLELGGSVAGFISESGGTEMLLAGGDVALLIRGFSLKGEYIFHLLGVSQDRMSWNHGVYGTALYDFEPVFVVGRYSVFFPDDRAPEYGFGEDPLKQLSVGIGVRMFENAELRVEYSSTLEEKGNAAFVQLAGGTAWQPTGLRR